jgi:alpha-1,3-glucan synthase
MGDLIGFQNFLNTTTPFKFDEHLAVWKSSRRYWDFQVSDERLHDCKAPRFWDEHADPLGPEIASQMSTCLNSDFDQVRN